MAINKKLQSQIIRMAQKDQEMRKSEKWNKNIDLKNTEKMKQIVKKFGWPDVDLVGKEASHMAWLLIQHADHDIDFQENCLRLIKQKLTQHKTTETEVAFLTDRVRIKQGKKQIYGTQFHINKKGIFAPQTIYDRKNLNKRRKKVGLGLFEEYEKRMITLQKKLIKK